MAKLSPFPKELHYDSQKISSNISHRKDKEGSLHAPNQILNYDLILVKFEKNMLSLIIQDALFRVIFLMLILINLIGCSKFSTNQNA